MTHLHPSLRHSLAVLALITQAPSAGLPQLGDSQELCAQACRIPAYLPQARHPAPLLGGPGAGSLWAAAAGWGAWMQPGCALGVPTVPSSLPPAL